MTDFLQRLQQISDRIETITAAEAIEHHKQNGICFVDLRDGLELQQYGQIPGARHCPRGSLEFRIPERSIYHEDYFSNFRRFVFYCSHGERSIFATDTAQKIGLANVCHIRGGMIAWVKAGGAVARFAGKQQELNK